MDDWEYSDESCPKCSSQLATRTCMSCGGHGWVDDDDEGWDECSDTSCDDCNGTGHETWCRECGWDDVYKEFLSPQYEAEWLAKQTDA